MKKRIAAFSLALVIIFTLLPVCASASEGVRFTDVKEGAFYYESVKWAVEQGITSGTTDTTFSPGRTCKRSEAVTFLWRAMGCPEPTVTSCPFTDVTPGKYYYKAALWAYENGIANGTSKTTFGPNEPCTRAQIVTFLFRATGEHRIQGECGFTDVSKSSSYWDAVNWASMSAITSGTTKTTFSPRKDCTRGQIVTFLYRTFAKGVEWRFLAVILRNADIHYTKSTGERVDDTTTMTDEEVNMYIDLSGRVRDDLITLSRGVIGAKMDYIVIDKTITFDDLVYSEGNGYWLDPKGAEKFLPSTVDLDYYDHITFFTDMDLEVTYLGLGGVPFSQNTGYSLIRVKDTYNASWIFDENRAWPSAAIVHEFLHFMETWSKYNNCGIYLGLHKGAEYYEDDPYWDKWYYYEQYINCEIPLSNGAYTGVPIGLWRQPPHSFR